MNRVDFLGNGICDCGHVGRIVLKKLSNSTISVCKEYLTEIMEEKLMFYFLRFID